MAHLQEDGEEGVGGRDADPELERLQDQALHVDQLCLLLTLPEACQKFVMRSASPAANYIESKYTLLRIYYALATH